MWSGTYIGQVLPHVPQFALSRIKLTPHACEAEPTSPDTHVAKPGGHSVPMQVGGALASDAPSELPSGVVTSGGVPVGPASGLESTGRGSAEQATPMTRSAPGTQ
jgi:hypothetical protein